jgi:hypothetical protein
LNPIFEINDLLLLAIEVVETFKLPLYVVHQLPRVRLEVLVQFLCQAREFLEGTDCLAQHRHLLEDGVVSIIETARCLQRFVGERRQGRAEVSDSIVNIRLPHAAV